MAEPILFGRQFEEVANESRIGFGLILGSGKSGGGESGNENPRESTLLEQLVLEANIPVKLWSPSKVIPLVVLGNVEGYVKNIQEHGYWRKTGARPMKKFLDIALDIYEVCLGTTKNSILTKRATI